MTFIPPAAAYKEMPEHKAYEFLFRRVAFFRKKVTEAGKPLAKDTGLQREAGLSEQQLSALEGISESCLREAEALARVSPVAEPLPELF